MCDTDRMTYTTSPPSMQQTEQSSDCALELFSFFFTQKHGSKSRSERFKSVKRRIFSSLHKVSNIFSTVSRRSVLIWWLWLCAEMKVSFKKVCKCFFNVLQTGRLVIADFACLLLAKPFIAFLFSCVKWDICCSPHEEPSFLLGKAAELHYQSLETRVEMRGRRCG